MRSSWLASAKKRRIRSWPASRSVTDAAMRPSIPFSAAPSRPTSLPVSAGPTRSARSPAVMRSARAAIISMGRSPRRMTRLTPTKMSAAAAPDPMMTMSRSWWMVASTSPRLMPATRVPDWPGTGTDETRYGTFPPEPVTVLALVLVLATWLTDWPGRGADPAPPCKVTGAPLTGTNSMAYWPKTSVSVVTEGL